MEVRTESVEEAPGRPGGDPTAGRIAYFWGLAGILALLLEAAFSLGSRGVTAVAGGLDPLQATTLVLLTAGFLYAEGVRGFQERWVPRVVGRLGGLRREAPLLRRLLAPLHAMGLVANPRGVLLRAWLGVAAIVTAVLIVRAFPEPWRGIVDLAVAIALLWGAGALLVQAVRASR